MSMRERGARGIPGLMLIALLVTACAPGVTHSNGGMDSGVRQQQPSEAGGSTDVYVQPVVLRNTAPSQLDVSLSLTLGGYDVQLRDTTTIIFAFSSAGRPVKFVGDERVTCGGKALTRYDGAYEETVPTASVAGKTLTCVYASGATSTSVTLAIPQAPVIVSPHDGARVPRATATTIIYHTPPGALMGVVAVGPSSKALPVAGAMTATQATINTSTFSAGVGDITLTENLASQPPAHTTFKSLQESGSAMTMIAVTWV